MICYYKEARAQLGTSGLCMLGKYVYEPGIFFLQRKNASGNTLDALVGNRNVSLRLNRSGDREKKVKRTQYTFIQRLRGMLKK